MPVTTRLTDASTTLRPAALACALACTMTAMGDSVPLTVIAPQDMVAASDGAAYDVMGTAMALQDDTLFVGSRGADGSALNGGAVYVFDYGDDGWEQVQKLTASMTGDNDETGTSLAVSGVRLAVGAPLADGAGEADAGRVVLFTFNGASWVESATIEAPTEQVEAHFGHVVALDGTTLAVGAPLHDSAVRNEGEVHLYTFDDDAATWSLSATVRAPDAGENDRFGYSLALAGDLLVVGVEADDDAGIDAGAAWVFRNVEGTWTAEAKLSGDEGEWFARFGCSVAIDATGETIAVGADRSDFHGVDSGAVMVFENLDADGSWLRSDTLGWGYGGEELGRSIALDGDTLVAGMPVSDFDGADSGGALLFKRAGNGSWSTQARIHAGDAAELELCGYAVAADNGRVALGRPLGGGSGTWSGNVLVLDLSADCNENGTPDVVDIANGTSDDSNGNGVPDSCECFGDLDENGFVDGSDLTLLLGSWGTPPPSFPQADINGDGLVNGSDLAIVLAYWGPCAAP